MLDFNQPQTIFFIIFAGLTIASSLLVVLHKNPVASAVFLVLAFFSLAGIYAVMNAVFIATMQVLVYAGAIMVLVVFVLMLLSLREETHKEIWNHPVKKTVIVLLVVLYSGLLIGAVTTRSTTQMSFALNSNYEYKLKQEGTTVISAKGNTASVGASTFLDYVLPFELISVLLLAAVVGAVIIAKKDQGEPKAK
jgi:NADH-quinone oxidoreductase subunit J